MLDLRVFVTLAIAGVAAPLTAIQFRYWAAMVYASLFLRATLDISLDVAGTALLAATRLVPLIGWRLATHCGWQRLFTTAFGLITICDSSLVIAALSDGAEMRLGATVAGMATIAVGAALANPQLTGAVLALAPSTQVGMALAVTPFVRQVNFAISIAALGPTLAVVDAAAEFAKPFALAAFAALPGVIAASVLLPAKFLQHRTRV